MVFNDFLFTFIPKIVTHTAYLPVRLMLKVLEHMISHNKLIQTSTNATTPFHQSPPFRRYGGRLYLTLFYDVNNIQM